MKRESQKNIPSTVPSLRILLSRFHPSTTRYSVVIRGNLKQIRLSQISTALSTGRDTQRHRNGFQINY
jgi:hypothetical protein